MKIRPSVGILLLMATGLLTACSSTPQRHDSNNGRLLEKPGDVDFGSVQANMMYEILVGEIATQRGQPDVAAHFYLEAAKKSHDPEIAARTARIASFAKEDTVALEAARIWVENDPGNLEATRMLTVFYIRTGKIEDTKKLVMTLLEASEERISRTILHIGAMLQREASEKSAVEISAFVSERYPQYAETHYVHASLLLGVNEKEQALAAVEKALKIKQDWIDAITLRARVLIQLSRSEEALTYLAKYLKSHPSEDGVRLTYARALVDVRRLEEARSQFELLAVKMPDNEDVLFTLAMLSMQFKQLDEADGYLRQLYKMGKSSSQVMYYLGQIAEQKENDSDALNWYNRISSGEYYLDSQLRIASVLARSNSLNEALEHIRALEIKTLEEKKEILIFEGNLLKNAGQFKDAYNLYSRGLDEFRNDIDLLYSRALVAEKLDRIDVTIEDLQFVLQREPDNAAAHNALGYTLADRTNRLEEALQHIKRAMELEPEDPAVIDSLGWVYFRLGQHDKAVELLRQAYTMIRDGEVAAHLGEALFVSGQTSEARQVWDEAREQFGDNEVLLQTMKRFGH
ncbi:MAG: tetratricopeptide repeat protein [Gammaproteobacteria bacterium]|nr:tetratricopeptide repeat protein [Gammaproteobacteria bacterium]